ncbi:Uncharacterised protein [BD1-7 clade bacterium]|uniref:Lipocalin-like domain-containing protein n=1 Tax=BD1-7 clade bacterium TaxID=2029982 RepID=A0A5S9PMS8_9GAMM|nr:Uncharacterised protein [BD1-7 clade bacterium]CAA0105224.1 Uncharacterised protein [BD1-7 clade bacterium]
MSASPFSGTYRLVSWENRLASGEVLYPMGDNAKGYISYSADGFVWVHIMADARRNQHHANPFECTPEEAVASALSHLSYCGKFEIDGSQIIHHVDICSFPNWVGTPQVRDWSVTDGQLSLSAKGIPFRGQTLDAYLIWAPVGT